MDHFPIAAEQPFDAVEELPPALADLPQWRLVHSGLVILHAGWIALPITLGLTFVLLTGSQGMWALYDWMQLGVILLWIVAGGWICVGQALCCQAPAEGGAKRYARATFALTFLGVAFTGMFAIATWLRDHELLPAPILALYPETVHLPLLALVAGLLLLVFIAACWISFLQAVAEVLQHGELAKKARSCRQFLFLWSLCLLVVPWFVIRFDQWSPLESALGVLPWLAAIAGVPFNYLWILILLGDTRQLVRNEIWRCGSC
jgi:hypothetical protein